MRILPYYYLGDNMSKYNLNVIHDIMVQGDPQFCTVDSPAFKIDGFWCKAWNNHTHYCFDKEINHQGQLYGTWRTNGIRETTPDERAEHCKMFAKTYLLKKTETNSRI